VGGCLRGYGGIEGRAIAVVMGWAVAKDAGCGMWIVQRSNSVGRVVEIVVAVCVMSRLRSVVQIIGCYIWDGD